MARRIGRPSYGIGGKAKINEKDIRCLPEVFSMWDCARYLRVYYNTVYRWVHRDGLPVYVGNEIVQPTVIHNQEDSDGNIVRDENANTPRYSIRRSVLINWLIERKQLPETARRYVTLVPTVR